MDVFSRLRASTLGIDSPAIVRTLDGSMRSVPRTYLDSAATCLAVGPIHHAATEYLLSTCSNSHTQSTSCGRDTTQQIADAHQDVLELFNAHVDHSAVFLGSGVTAATLFASDAIRSTTDRPVALVSALEHHSNLLPWRRHFTLAYVAALDDGGYDLSSLSALLREHAGKVAVVAVTAVSNVTGVMPPLAEIARLAHDAGALVYVDAAQAAAHVALDMRRDRIDFLGASGHKMYAPGSPGVLIGPRAFFQGLHERVGPVGGGSVRRVQTDQVWLKNDPSERYEAGTPNIPGSIALGASARLLRRIGLDAIRAHETDLIATAMDRLTAIDDLVVYGPLDPSHRVAVVAFNLGQVPHGVVASALNDLFAVQTRNDCFCAQPYVRQQLLAACSTRGYCRPLIAGKTGMVRASFGVYSNHDDVMALVSAVAFIQRNLDAVMADYEEVADGVWKSRTFRACTGYSYRSIVDRFEP